MVPWTSEFYTRDSWLIHRLPDVRPYLYHVGYCAGDSSELNIDRWDASQVEEYFVKAGREYLLVEWERGLG
jgi:hypothetical protein